MFTFYLGLHYVHIKITNFKRIILVLIIKVMMYFMSPKWRSFDRVFDTPASHFFRFRWTASVSVIFLVPTLDASTAQAISIDEDCSSLNVKKKSFNDCFVSVCFVWTRSILMIVSCLKCCSQGIVALVGDRTSKNPGPNVV